MTDVELMAAHVAGDRDAFAELVRRHTGRLWAVAVRTLRDPDDAADALQDAMVSAFRNAGSYRGDAAVTTWLHRIVVNACLDRLRRAKARPTVPLPEQDLPLRRDDHEHTLTRIDLVEAMARLPEPQRAAIALVDLHDLSVADAAGVLGIAEGTVKSRCARGRAALAQMLTPAVVTSDHPEAAGNPDHPEAAGNPDHPEAAGNPDDPASVTPPDDDDDDGDSDSDSDSTSDPGDRTEEDRT